MDKAIQAKGEELIEKFDGNINHCVKAVEEIIKAVTNPSPEMEYHVKLWNEVLNYLKSKQ